MCVWWWQRVIETLSRQNKPRVSVAPVNTHHGKMCHTLVSSQSREVGLGQFCVCPSPFKLGGSVFSLTAKKGREGEHVSWTGALSLLVLSVQSGRHRRQRDTESHGRPAWPGQEEKPLPRFSIHRFDLGKTPTASTFEPTFRPGIKQPTFHRDVGRRDDSLRPD